MFVSAIGLLLSVGTTPCSDAEQGNGHIVDVCDDYGEPAHAYSATMYASLSPRPAQQQVMIFRYEGAWWIRIAGYKWERGTPLVQHRRSEFPLGEEEASKIIALMSDDALDRLATQPFYGDEGVICTDGATYELALAKNRQRRNADQHSCAGKTEINQIMSEFRSLALKYDPEFEGMLTGLTN